MENTDGRKALQDTAKLVEALALDLSTECDTREIYAQLARIGDEIEKGLDEFDRTP